MAQIRRAVVQRNEWVDDAEFLELLSLAQILPGANPVNMAVLVGNRLRGVPGAAVALAASTIPGLLMLLVIAALSLGTHAPAAQGALRGCAAAALGLSFTNAVQMSRPYASDAVDLGLIAATALAVALGHAPLWLALAVFVPLSLLMHRKATT